MFCKVLSSIDHYDACNPPGLALSIANQIMRTEVCQRVDPSTAYLGPLLSETSFGSHARSIPASRLVLSDETLCPSFFTLQLEQIEPSKLTSSTGGDHSTKLDTDNHFRLLNPCHFVLMPRFRSIGKFVVSLSVRKQFSASMFPPCITKILPQPCISLPRM